MPESSEYDKSGVSSQGAETALSGLLKHVLPTRKFSDRYPLAADIGYFANVIDLGNGTWVTERASPLAPMGSEQRSLSPNCSVVMTPSVLTV